MELIRTNIRKIKKKEERRKPGNEQEQPRRKKKVIQVSDSPNGRLRTNKTHSCIIIDYNN